jgi:hypothetical protein
MVHALEADLFALRSRPTSAPGTRPEPTDVELPTPAEEIARSEPATPAFDDAPLPPIVAAPATAAIVDEPAMPEVVDDSGAATHEIDVRSLFTEAQAGKTVESAEQSSASVSPPPPVSSGPAPKAPSAGTNSTANNGAGLQPIDLLGTDGVDADVLDDDAFFATLRDAVHDEAPLGPRDENDVTGENTFFDQDADRGSFRDVFRRRR